MEGSPPQTREKEEIPERFRDRELRLLKNVADDVNIDAGVRREAKVLYEAAMERRERQNVEKN